jgi:hypothetical protein
MIHYGRSQKRGDEMGSGGQGTKPTQAWAPTASTYVVPPALAEVGQLVLQAVLQELEHDADDHAHPPVADHEGLKEAPSGLTPHAPAPHGLCPQVMQPPPPWWGPG